MQSFFIIKFLLKIYPINTAKHTENELLNDVSAILDIHK